MKAETAPEHASSIQKNSLHFRCAFSLASNLSQNASVLHQLQSSSSKTNFLQQKISCVHACCWHWDAEGQAIRFLLFCRGRGDISRGALQWGLCFGASNTFKGREVHKKAHTKCLVHPQTGRGVNAVPLFLSSEWTNLPSDQISRWGLSGWSVEILFALFVFQCRIKFNVVNHMKPLRQSHKTAQKSTYLGPPIAHPSPQWRQTDGQHTLYYNSCLPFVTF